MDFDLKKVMLFAIYKKKWLYFELRHLLKKKTLRVNNIADENLWVKIGSLDHFHKMKVKCQMQTHAKEKGMQDVYATFGCFGR